MSDCVTLIGISRAKCHKCKKPMDLYDCPEKSCTQCLGDASYYRCVSCDWRGDITDLNDELMNDK